jgi:cytochrome c oxidase subunit 3
MTEATLHEPFVERRQQRLAFDFGMWSFLATEIMFFGGMFACYAVARHAFDAGFHAAGHEVSFVYGTMNTAILMTSSLTMALAERASEARRLQIARAMLAGTLILGGAFLVVKGFEYREDFEKHLFPTAGFALQQPGARLFFALYWVMTGVHAIHVITGLTFVGRLLLFALKRDLFRHELSVSASTLFWHLIDIIWVILYPLLYLVGRT